MISYLVGIGSVFFGILIIILINPKLQKEINDILFAKNTISEEVKK